MQPTIQPCSSTPHAARSDPNRLVTSRAARALVVRLGKLVVEAEVVRSLEHVWPIARPEDVALLALPLGLVDGVDPVLDLHDDAAVLLHGARAGGDVEEALGLLEGEGACTRYMLVWLGAGMWKGNVFVRNAYHSGHRRSRPGMPPAP